MTQIVIMRCFLSRRLTGSAPGLGLLLLLAGQVFAQSDPVPDTLDWRGYYPLEIGNQWHYEIFDFNVRRLVRHHIPRDTLIQGRQYFVLRFDTYDEDDQRIGSSTRYIRYSDNGGHLVHVPRLSDGSFLDESYWSFLPCGLDAPFEHQERYPCEGEASGVDIRSFGGYGGRVILGSDTVEVAAVKEFDTLGGVFVFAHEVGLVQVSGEGGQVLAFARVGDLRIGEPLVSTAKETEPAVPAGLAIVSVYPNPFRTTATVHFQVRQPDQLTVEVFNVLGQRVHVEAMQYQLPGAHRYVLDGSRLSAGLYFVRIRTGSDAQAVHSATLIR